jgi:hypothetical protein
LERFQVFNGVAALLITFGNHRFGPVKVAFDDSLLNLNLLLIKLLIITQDFVKVSHSFVHFTLIVITHRNLLSYLINSRLDTLLVDSVAQFVDLTQLLETG